MILSLIIYERRFLPSFFIKDESEAAATLLELEYVIHLLQKSAYCIDN